MLNSAHNQRLSELVAFPREDLNTELKGWLSPSDETDRANIAKALLALANTGGGYLLIGFDERDGAWVPGPAATATEFSQDVINQIVARYADPPFQCAVYQVAGQDGEPLHPVIVVPGNHRVPIRAKSEDPTRKHVRIHSYYIRRPGPCSDQPQSANEWDDLLRRCMLAARDELLAAFRHIMQQDQPSPPSPVQDALLAWDRESRERFAGLVKDTLADEIPSRYAAGIWSAAYELNGSFARLDLKELRGVLDQVCGHETGWPPWWVPTRSEIAPYTYNDTIECWMREARFDGTSDFWRASPGGRLFLLRSYQEDFEGGFDRGTTLVISSHLWTIGEVLLHAHRLAQALTKEPLDVKFRCRWDGLADRTLGSWRRHFGAADHRCRQDSVTAELQCKTDEIIDALPELVGRLTKPLFQAFDFYTPTPQFVQREIAELRKSRV
jgi:hypothetical protein